MSKKSIFKSVTGKEKILNSYKQLLLNVDFEYQEIIFDTTFGKTYVLKAGDKSNPPLLLLHGSSSNCAMWFGDIKILSKSFYVICVDVIGEAGNSCENRLDLNSNDYAHWICEIVENLSLNKVSLIGNSYGGWLSLKFASVYPNMVDKMVLIAASGIVNVRLSFVFKSILFLMQGKKGISKLMKYVYGTDDIPDEVLDFSNLIMENFNPMTGALPMFSQNEIEKITSKALFIYGENDVTCNVNQVIDRVESIPNGFTKIIKNNGHVVYDQTETIINFIKEGKVKT